MTQSTDKAVIAALYKFTTLTNLDGLQGQLSELCRDLGIKGILLLATEGINGTVAGTRANIDVLLAKLRDIPGLGELEHKESFADAPPFYRMKVRIKKEIVTMGVPGIDPNKVVGTYVKPQDWNSLICDPDVVVVDTRNDYEVRIGTFEGAIDPKIVSFGDFPDWVDARDELSTKPRVAMFCTGGIRCEKATALMKERGFDEVYHLEGGILKYLEEVPPAESLWRGECFVFDQRVAVGHGLQIGDYELCFGCREPITKADQESDKFVAGVCCPHCHDSQSERQHARFSERQRQIDHARSRGQVHFGPQNR